MRAVWVNICCRNSILYAQLRLGRPNLKDRKTMSIEKPRVVSQLLATQYYRLEVTAPDNSVIHLESCCLDIFIYVRVHECMCTWGRLVRADHPPHNKFREPKRQDDSCLAQSALFWCEMYLWQPCQLKCVPLICVDFCGRAMSRSMASNATEAAMSGPAL